jgi:hypothetical protein
VLAAWTTRTVDDRQVSLSVPSNWNVGQAWVIPGSFADLIGSFSNQPLSPPCTTSGNSIACGPPLQSLQPRGILVDVYNNGAPTWSLSSEPGVPATVSGLSAKVDVQTGGGLLRSLDLRTWRARRCRRPSHGVRARRAARVTARVMI